MKKNSLQSYKVQCRTKTELKTTNQIPKSPLRMSSLGVVHCTPVTNQLNFFKIQKTTIFMIHWSNSNMLISGDK